MGKPRKHDRGLGDRGIENRRAPILVSATRAISSLTFASDDQVPAVLAMGLRLEAELRVALASKPDDVQGLCERLLEAWRFLWDAQERAMRHPKDAALLVSGPFARMRAEKRETEVRPTYEGSSESFLATTSLVDARPEDLAVWAPTEVPPGYDAQKEGYPERPRRLAEIPPFFPDNVRAWEEAISGGGGMYAETPPPRGDHARAKKPADPAVDAKAAEVALAQAEENARRLLVDVKVAMATDPETPEIKRALVNLEAISLVDVTRQTDVKLVDDATPLLQGVEAFLFHGRYSVVLDRTGEPTTLRGRLRYPILVGEPGSRMRRDFPPPGAVYISVQRYGYSTFRVEGSRIQKVLFGGVGGFRENHGGGVFSPHPLHVTIESYLASYGRFTYIAGLTSRGAVEPLELSLGLITDRAPELARATLPFAVKEVIARLPKDRDDLVQLLKQIGFEIIRELIIEELRERVIAFVVKKVGGRLVPFVNLALALWDVFDDEATAQMRAAIACALMAIQSRTTDEMTISAKVMGGIVADEVANRVIEIVVAKGIAKAKSIGRGKGGAPGDAATDGTSNAKPPAATPDAAPADANGAGTKPPPVSAPGAPTASDAVDVPTANRLPPVSAPGSTQPARHDAPADVGRPERIDAPTAVKPGEPLGLTGTAKPDDPPPSQPRAPTRKPDGADATDATKKSPPKEPDEPDAEEHRRDDRATDDRGLDDTSASDTGLIHRVGVDDERVGVSPRSGDAVRTNRDALTRPSKPAVPSREGALSIKNREVNEAVHTHVNGVPVNSRHPDVLVGARTDNHRQDVLAVVAADPNHPLRGLIDETSIGSPDGPKFKTPSYAKSEMAAWRDHPEDWQSGHVRSNRAGDADVLVVQTRYHNQRGSADRERTGDVTMNGAFIIGGIAVDKESARLMRERGVIRMTSEELEKLPTIDFDKPPDRPTDQ